MEVADFQMNKICAAGTGSFVEEQAVRMGIPNILLSKGYKVMTLGYIPGMSLDISGDYPNMYWPFGDHLLAGAKLIANHPNL